MAWVTRIDSNHRVLYTRVSGRLSCHDAIAHRVVLAANPTFDGTFCHILDLQRVDHVDLTPTDVQTLAAGSVLSSPARQMLVAPADAVYGVCRMYSARREGWPGHEDITICRSLAEAYRQLGIEEVLSDPPTPS